MMAEYVHMTTASALLATFYFGGWNLLPGMSYLMDPIGQGILFLSNAVLSGAFEFSITSVLAQDLARVLLEVASFTLKVAFFLWFFVWVRWTLPRFRYDQLMALGWKVLLPLSILNIFITGGLIYFGVF